MPAQHPRRVEVAAMLAVSLLLVDVLAYASPVRADPSDRRAASRSVQRHRTRLSLRLQGNLVALGTVHVPDGTRRCHRRVVNIQTYTSSWVTILTTRSSSTGAYQVEIPAVPGDYRGVVLRKRAGRQLCLRDRSPIRTYSGPPPPKPLAAGLLRASVMPASDWRDIIGGWVPVVYWRDLQPTPDGPLDTSSIDALVQKAEQAGLTLRLRIFAGRAAPDWVKQRFGTVTVEDPYDGITATVPRWWASGYMDTYEAFQSKLAARYDGEPTIRAVTVSGAMTIYAEPFIRGMSSATTRANLLAAGYTSQADQAAILASIDAQAPWQQTRQILAFNPWQHLEADGSWGLDVSFTNTAMDYFRSVFGDRAILQNNSIRSSWITGTMPPLLASMYGHMAGLGGPISFQTARASRVGDLPTVLQWCVDQGAHAVELQGGFDTQLTFDEARRFDTLLQANA